MNTFCLKVIYIMCYLGLVCVFLAKYLLWVEFQKWCAELVSLYSLYIL